MYRELHAATDRDTVARITSRQRLKIWINGEAVHEDDGLPADDDSVREVELPLDAGVNGLLVKVSDANGGAGLLIEVTRGGDPEAALEYFERASPTAEGLLSGRDEPLEAAVRWLRGEVASRADGRDSLRGGEPNELQPNP